MHVASISVANFRGFPKRQQIDLDGDIVVIWGANGTGKTSLLDAFQWLVLGELPRLQATTLRTSEDVITSRYADGPASVEVVFRAGTADIAVTRTGAGKDGRLTIAESGAQIEGAEAQERLAALLGRPDSHPDQAAWFLRTHLLQQAEMTELLSGDTRERYKFLAQLTGLDELGRLDELLQKELRQLRAATRARVDELSELTGRVHTARQEHEESLALLRGQAHEQDVELTRAVAALRELLGPVQPTGSEAPEALLEAERRIAEISFLLGQLHQPATEAALADTQRQEAENHLAETERLEALLTEREAEISELARAMNQAREALDLVRREHDNSQRLAELALVELGESCPVCGQEHDLDNTRQRLEQMLRGDDRPVKLERELAGLEQRRLTLERALIDLQESARDAATAQRREEERNRAAREHRVLREQLERRLRELVGEPPDGDLIAHAESRAARIEDAARAVHARQREGAARAALERRAEAAQRDLRAREARLAEMEAEAALLRGRTERADHVCKWVGREIVAATGRVVAESNPLADELYQRLDVHPTFRRFSLKLDRFRESGHLRPWIHDDEEEKDASAAQLLSAAQFNSLAVCLFLALNLERDRPLKTVVLDDPVQSMDDINILSLVDVLRTVRQERQVVLTTHDVVLAQLLLRKLRPLTQGQRVLLVKLGDWTREGPSVEVEDRNGEGQPPYELVREST